MKTKLLLSAFLIFNLSTTLPAETYGLHLYDVSYFELAPKQREWVWNHYENSDLCKLINACKNGNLCEIYYFIFEKNVDVNMRAPSYPFTHLSCSFKTPLAIAASNGDFLTVANLILRCKANINIESGDRSTTPLMNAISSYWSDNGNSVDTVEFLIRHGADLTNRNSWQVTALQFAKNEYKCLSSQMIGMERKNRCKKRLLQIIQLIKEAEAAQTKCILPEDYRSFIQ